MENLKKELQEKGYTFFKMQDYPQFEEEYQYFKKYICNSETNLLNIIASVRADGHYLKNSPKFVHKNIGFNINETLETFEQIEHKFNTETLPHIDFESFNQYWYYGQNVDINNDFKKLINKIVLKLYGEESQNLSDLMFLSYYKKGCFLKPHRDGKSGTRICAILIYLNDEDYNTEWGGNIIFEGTETVAPIYGNIAVLDFKEGNCLHEVQEVIGGYGRYAILDFVSLVDSNNTPDSY
jgi:hypothetical protein